MDSAVDSGGDTGDSDAPVPWEGPAIVLSDCEGRDTSLASLVEGRQGLLAAIGASWCAPCQEDVPGLEAFHAEHPELALTQILVQDSAGNPATHVACDEWTDAFSLTFPVLVDPLYLTEEFVGEAGFPAHVAWRPDGTEVYRQNGAFDAEAVLAAFE